MTRHAIATIDSPCKNKHHPQSDENDWHRSPWLFSQYFWNESHGNVAIFTNLQTFYYSKRSTRSYVDEPKCNSQFLAMVIKWNTFFSFSTSYKTKLRQDTNLTSYMNLANLCSFAWISINWGWSSIDNCGE